MKKLFGLLPLLAALSAGADDAGLLRCRALIDNAARLACYDALLPTAITAAEPAPAVAATPSAAVAPVATSTSTTTSTPTPAVAPLRPQTEAEFGMERKAAEARLENIVSRIIGPFTGWQAKSKITLENGQVWQIVDGSSGSYSLDSPAVSIERGVFGTFFLKIEGANRTPKVKRVK